MPKPMMAFAIAAAAALGACATPPPTGGAPQPNPKIVTNVHPYKAGNGVVQAVYPAPTAAAPAAGSTAGPMQRLEIKMSDGSIQYVDTSSREFTKGTRVTLSEDRFIKKS
jgi:hypothetical protein